MSEPSGSASSAGRIEAPYGSWASPIAIDQLAVASVGIREPSAFAGGLAWLEGRPDEGGRQALVTFAPDGEVVELGPPGVNVRSRVHEYGGGATLIRDDLLLVSDFATGRLLRRTAGGAWEPLTADAPWRFADADLDARHGRLVAVREDRDPSTMERHGEAMNELVTIDLADGSVRVVASGRDFYAAPRVAPDGARLSWLEWDHPNMPWDGTELRLAAIGPDGELGPAETIAGDASTWVSQPRWDPDGSLWYAAEPGPWAGLYRRPREGRVEAMTAVDVEFASPDWIFGQQTYLPVGDGTAFAVGRSGGRDRLYRVGPAPGELIEIELPFTEYGAILLDGGTLVAAVAAPDRGLSLVRIDPAAGTWTVLRAPGAIELDPGDLSIGQPVDFPSTDGRTAHGIYYPPHSRRFHGPAGERPPLIVTSHGGPTAAAFTGLSITVQAFTSRGIAVLDVDYAGSTGYGRDYRRALEGEWGIADVDDCVAGARWLAAQGLVDGDRLAVRGGSASGFTTLAALAFRDVFAAGISYFGLGTLEGFVHDTHKFESRYLERLIGPFPAMIDRYRERSPNLHADRIRVPALILQGAEDRVVPPSEAERIVTALRENGVPHAYLLFPGEDHGFRQAASIRRSFEAELSFLGQVFGFTPADDLPPLPLEGGPG